MKKRASSSSKPKATKRSRPTKSAKSVAPKSARLTAKKVKRPIKKAVKKISRPIKNIVSEPVVVEPVIAQEVKSILPVVLPKPEVLSTPSPVEHSIFVSAKPEPIAPAFPAPAKPAQSLPTYQPAWQVSPEVERASLEEKLTLESKRILVRTGVTLGMIIIFGIWAYNFRQIISNSSFTSDQSSSEFTESLDSIYKNVNQQLNGFQQPPTIQGATTTITDPAPAATTTLPTTDAATNEPGLTPDQIESLKQNLPTSPASDTVTP